MQPKEFTGSRTSELMVYEILINHQLLPHVCYGKSFENVQRARCPHQWQRPQRRLLTVGGLGSRKHLYDVTGHDEDFLWETPQESRSETPRQPGAVWRLIVAIRDEWLQGRARLKLTRRL